MTTVSIEKEPPQVSYFKAVLSGDVLYDATDSSPMPHGGNHVLSDPKSGNRIVTREDIPVVVALDGLNGIVGLFEPTVPGRKRFMSR